MVEEEIGRGGGGGREKVIVWQVEEIVYGESSVGIHAPLRVERERMRDV